MEHARRDAAGQKQTKTFPTTRMRRGCSSRSGASGEARVEEHPNEASREIDGERRAVGEQEVCC